MSEQRRNALLELARREKRRRASSAAVLSPGDWAIKHRRIDDKPFSFDRHLPLRQIYDDNHKFVVVMKPAQVGLSELAATWAIHALDVGAQYWHTDKAGLNVAYLFPTSKSLSDFSKERLSGIQSESEHITNMFAGGYDEVTFKQAGASYLYLRGAWASKTGNNASLKTFPADLLILDEFDEMAAQSVALAEKRLRASSVQRRLYVSTPTLPGRGIHAAYLLSDQHEWEIPCDFCGEWNTLDFFRDVRADGVDWTEWSNWERFRLRAAVYTVHCPSCRREINRCKPGRWVARQPEITDRRGYHVPSLCFPIVSLVDLAMNATSDNPHEVEEFYRSDLGVPYQKSGANVTDAMLDKLSTYPVGYSPTWSRTTMGVDVGARFHYQITSTGPDQARYHRAMGSVTSWDALDDLMREYQVQQCVIDAHPELHACQQWASRWSGRVLRAYYPASVAMTGLLYRVDEEARKIQINRTMALDAVFATISSGMDYWTSAMINDDEVRRHLKSSVRVLVQNAHGQDIADWVHNGPDHLFHAMLYNLIAYRTLPAPTVGGLVNRGVSGWSVVSSSPNIRRPRIR